MPETTKSSPPVYYYGCIGKPGHYLHIPAASPWDGKVHSNPDGWPKAWASHYAGGQIDGTLCPRGRQVEGAASLHHVEGWTALAFWDRSVDRRPASNSVFVVREWLDFPAMLERARAAWPDVFARFSFPVVPGATNAEAPHA